MQGGLALGRHAALPPLHHGVWHILALDLVMRRAWLFGDDCRLVVNLHSVGLTNSFMG